MSEHSETKTFNRFVLAQRVEHILLIVSFMTLVITGLPQKYAGSGWAEWMIAALGGIEIVRIIHRIAAAMFIFEGVYHFVVVAYKLYVQRVKPTMLPGAQDGLEAWQALRYNLGFSKEKPKAHRYNFAEKAEYWAMLWGFIVMVITGFMLWNPIATTRALPGQFIPAAKTAHGSEALLAFLAILLWHFYFVHLRNFNKSMFTGKLTREEMEDEHALELQEIEAGAGHVPPPPKEVARRRTIFVPVVGALSVVALVGLYIFMTFEQTAITTVPPVSNVPAFEQRTPTPMPTAAPTATAEAIASGDLTWTGGVSRLFLQRCGNCHGPTQSGGYSVQTYEQALAGGDTGVAIIPGEPDTSPLVIQQAAGSHPGLFSPEVLEQIKEWIAAGAPE